MSTKPMYKTITLLHINIELDKKAEKSIPLTVAFKKYLGISLTCKVKELYYDNLKTLKK